MVDLVQEYFQRDLNPAEHEALSKLLGESPEATLKYADLLEQNYLATGLPQPTLPKSLRYLPHTGAGSLAGGLTKFLMIGLAAAGIALWKYWPQPNVEVSPSLQQPGSARPMVRPIHRGITKPAPIQPEAVGPSQEGKELSVVVNSPQRSLVTVRILDAQGKEVRALYTGFVEAGRWSFQWDGLLENGEPANTGDYLIDVQSGEAHLSKNIQIKLQPLSP